MSKPVRTTVFALVAGIALPLAAAEAASRHATDLLKYVPADTPYVFVSLEPLPDKVADKFEPTVDRIMLAYQRVIRYTMEQKLSEGAVGDDDAGEIEKIRSLVDEVLGLMSVKGIRDIGIQRDSVFAFYGHGLLPVLRLRLSDEKLFDQAIARIEGKAEKQLTVGNVSDETYKYLELEGVRLAIATLDGYAVLTVVPAEFDESQLAVVFGLDKPRKSLAKSRELRSIAKQYGFTDYFAGFVNNERIASAFVDEPTGLNEALLALFDYDAAVLPDACKSEFVEVAGIAPRMVFGYSELNDKYIDSEVIVELRSDIAKGLATLPATVPGLGQDYGGLVSLGFSVNPLAARQFYESRLDALEADPFECEMLAGVQNGVPAGREVLNKPVPPVVYNFRGFLAVVSDIQGMDIASEKPPESIDASLLVAIENAQDLVTMVAMLDPQIAALNLLPDGKPVKLEIAQLTEFASQAFAALSEGAVAVSVGEGSEANAANMLVADGSNPAPLFSMSMDVSRYYGFIGEAMMEAGPDEGEEEMPVEVRNAMRDVMTLLGDLYKRMHLDVRMTERGIEMGSHLTLAD